MWGKGETGKEDRGKIVDLRFEIADWGFVPRTPTLRAGSQFRNSQLLIAGYKCCTSYQVQRQVHRTPREGGLLDPLLAAVELV
jgi:hypothetical protein